MKTYAYRGFDASGRTRKGLVQADDVKGAREALARDGVLVDKLWASGRRERPMRPPQRAALYRELVALLESGLPVVPALDLLIQSPDMRNAAGRLSAVRDAVREGAALSVALSGAGCGLTDFERAIVDVAEQSGDVGGVLRRLSVFMESQARIRERVCSALIYPAFVAGMGLLAAVVMLGVLLPRARQVIADSRLDAPALTRAVIRVGELTLRWGWVVALAALIAGVLSARRLRRSEAARQAADRFIFRLPFFGHGYRLLVNLRFADALGLLLRGGAPIVSGLVLAGRATASAWCAELVSSAAEQVRNGANLGEAIGRVPPLSGEMTGVVHVGQASGNLAELLDASSRRLEARWERFVTRALALLEPLLILVVGGFVLLVTLAVLLPVLSLTQAVGQ
jgi:general secretion pathway protein F